MSDASISKELLYAILSMDSYYRGTTADGTPINVIPGERLGDASINYNYTPSAGLPDWNSVGFSATVYTSAGQQVIAYRGTDNIGLNIGAYFNGGDLFSQNSDALHGWLLGAGYYPAAQGQLAIDLYQQVAGHPISQGGSSSIKLTGHSLGGGLAGYVSVLSGSQAIGYDHMPFRLAATLKMSVDAIDRISTIVSDAFKNGADTLDASTISALIAEIGTIRLPDYSSFKGIAVDEEALQYAREAYTQVLSIIGEKLDEIVLEAITNALGEYTGIPKDFYDFILERIGTVLDLVDVDVPSIGDLADQLNTIIVEVVNELTNQTTLDNYGWDPVAFEALQGILGVLAPISSIMSDIGLLVPAVAPAAKLLDTTVTIANFLNSTIGRIFDAVAKHSQATLVALQFAKDNENIYKHWKDGVNLQLGDLPDVALSALNSAGIGQLALNGSSYLQFNSEAIQNAGRLLSVAVAYSALDHGERPFGDTGIWAYFNDLSELGKVLGSENVNVIFRNSGFNFFDMFELRATNTGFSDALTHIATQYAGALAFNAVEEEGNDTVDSREGVLKLSSDESDLSIDLSSVLWGDVLRSGGYQGDDSLAITSQDQLFSAYFSRSEVTRGWLTALLGIASFDSTALGRLAQIGWDSDERSIIDRLHVATKNDPGTINMSERVYEVITSSGSDTHVDVYIGSDHDETLYDTKSNDLLLLEGGNDTIYASAGSDLINAGRGNDLIVDRIASDALQTKVGDTAPDIFVGDNLNRGYLETFLDWLRSQVNLDDEDIVRYTIALNNGSLAPKGLKVERITSTRVGERDGLEVTIRDQNTRKLSVDKLVNVDIIQLSERADILNVTDDVDQAAILVDMDWPSSGTLLKSDFDTVSFVERRQGAVSLNGSISEDQAIGDPSLISLLWTGIKEIVGSASGGLLGDSANLYYRGAENVTLSEHNDIFFGGNINSFLGQNLGRFFGTPNHPGFGEIKGEDGNDIVIFYGPEHVRAGGTIPGTQATAAEEFKLTLDGGKGNDWVIALGGDQAIVAGGLGRDWIINSSKDGESWGDYAIGISPDGNRAEDSRENSDMFWYFPDTKVMDAQHHDFLSFFGIPMTGGDAAASVVALALGAASGNLTIASSVVGIANSAAFATGNKVYFDNLMPFITYKMDGEDLLVGNIFDGFFRAVTGQPGIYSIKDADGNRRLDIGGVMRIKNFDFASSYWGYEQFDLGNELGESDRPAGTMNMVFKKGNPVIGFLSLMAAILPPTAISAPFLLEAQLLATFDALLVFIAAGLRSAKAIGWAIDADPLVIDLDGDGIETIAQSDSNVYFDIDNDLFAERNGWIKGDDGFLVLDRNGNGQIDDITEMFGSRFGGGYADLASYDANRDIAISAADPTWAALRVWQDKDGDGITDSGELHSLDQLGIASLSLAKDPLATTTPQGVQLIGRSTVSFADGSTSRMFEALLPASDIDSSYAGESGRPDWLSDLKPDSKGFGSITNLAVAMANDVGFSQLVANRANAMASPKLMHLVEQVGDVLGAWGQTMETTRELTPVRVGPNAQGQPTLLDWGVYAEDGAGGYWSLASGDAIRNGAGQPISRASLEDLLAMEGGWRLEQTWSPQTRGTGAPRPIFSALLMTALSSSTTASSSPTAVGLSPPGTPC